MERVAHENQAIASHFKNDMFSASEPRMMNYGNSTMQVVQDPAGMISEYENYTPI